MSTADGGLDPLARLETHSLMKLLESTAPHRQCVGPSHGVGFARQLSSPAVRPNSSDLGGFPVAWKSWNPPQSSSFHHGLEGPKLSRNA